jgi:hypothetical protein
VAGQNSQWALGLFPTFPCVITFGHQSIVFRGKRGHSWNQLLDYDESIFKILCLFTAYLLTFTFGSNSQIMFLKCLLLAGPVIDTRGKEVHDATLAFKEFVYVFCFLLLRCKHRIYPQKNHP